MRNVVTLVLSLTAGIGLGLSLKEPLFGALNEPVEGSVPSDEIDAAVPKMLDRIATLEREVDEYRTRLGDATKQIAAYEASAATPVSHRPPTAASEPQVSEEGVNKGDEVAGAAKWRISAIEKFVPLTAQQKERLQASFKDKSEGHEGESLDSILGAESARYYREQVAGAFKRMRDQELEKEILFTARKLQLAPDQEQKLRQIFTTIEIELATTSTPTQEGGGTPQERVKRMVEEGKRRAALRAERTKPVLSDQQYQEFLKSESESPEADMQIFHDSDS